MDEMFFQALRWVGRFLQDIPGYLWAALCWIGSALRATIEFTVEVLFAFLQYIPDLLGAIFVGIFEIIGGIFD